VKSIFEILTNECTSNVRITTKYIKIWSLMSFVKVVDFYYGNKICNIFKQVMYIMYMQTEVDLNIILIIMSRIYTVEKSFFYIKNIKCER
jgi:hypothetical protein